MKKIFYAFVLVLLLASCQKEQAELSLAIPQNIVQNGEILTWDMVEDATFYTISFGNVRKKSFETTFSLLEFSNGTYDVKIMANTVSEQSDFQKC